MDFHRSTPFDSTAIAKLEQDCFSDPWSERSVSDLITTEGSMCFTASDNGEVIAYVLGRLIPPEGEIYRIAVRQDKRRRGIGYRLLDYAVKTSRGKGLESLFLEVRARNIAARKLYLSYGFVEIGKRNGYYKNPDDDAVIMLKGGRDLIDC